MTDYKFELPNIPTAAMVFDNTSSDEMRKILEEGQNHIAEIKRKEREMLEENNRYLKKIANNTDRIVHHMENIHKLLITLNNLSEGKEEKLNKILIQLEETKHIEADVYSVICSMKFKTEEERVNTSGQLTNLFMNGLDVSSNLISVITALSLNQ